MSQASATSAQPATPSITRQFVNFACLQARPGIPAGCGENEKEREARAGNSRR
jgi:hypothetical protein